MLAFWLIEKLSTPLVVFGFAGQVVFMLRFLVQWLVSERRGRSTIPIAFWWISIAGGVMLFAYGWFDQDPVIILGQTLGLGIYSRNLMLIYRRRVRVRRRFGAEPGPLLGEGLAEEAPVGSTERQPT